MFLICCFMLFFCGCIHLCNNFGINLPHIIFHGCTSKVSYYDRFCGSSYCTFPLRSELYPHVHICCSFFYIPSILHLFFVWFTLSHLFLLLPLLAFLHLLVFFLSLKTDIFLFLANLLLQYLNIELKILINQLFPLFHLN